MTAVSLLRAPLSADELSVADRPAWHEGGRTSIPPPGYSIGHLSSIHVIRLRRSRVVDPLRAAGHRPSVRPAGLSSGCCAQISAVTAAGRPNTTQTGRRRRRQQAVNRPRYICAIQIGVLTILCARLRRQASPPVSVRHTAGPGHHLHVGMLAFESCTVHRPARCRPAVRPRCAVLAPLETLFPCPLKC